MIRRVLPLLLAALLLPACSSPTYINVPPADGDVAFNNANSRTVRDIEQVALAAVLAARPISGDVAIRFPRGTSELTAITVISDLPENVVPEGDTATGEYTLVEVRAVRVRGGTGEVDIVRPGTTRDRELVTVTMKWRPLNGWTSRGMRVWGFGVDQADRNLLVDPAAERRQPAYQPVPDPAPAPTPEDESSEDAPVEPEPME